LTLSTYASLDLFRVVMYDAGACSQANARATRGLGLHYVMVLNEAQPTLHAEAKRLDMGPGTLVTDDQKRVRYTVWRNEELAGFLDWSHLKTIVRVRREELDARGQVSATGERYFVTSLRQDALTPAQWATLLRSERSVSAWSAACARGDATGVPLPELLDQIVRLIEAQAVGMLCSLLLVDRAKGVVRHGAAPSLPEAFTRAIDGVRVGPAEGSCGTAAYRGEVVVVEDIATHPYWLAYRELALPHGLRACWSSPILSSGRDVLGTFAMYYREPRCSY